MGNQSHYSRCLRCGLRCRSFPKPRGEVHQSREKQVGFYAELLPVICAGELELLDHPRLIKQLSTLERRTRSGGKDVIDHPVNQHDDLANALAGVVVLSATKKKKVGAGGF